MSETLSQIYVLDLKYDSGGQSQARTERYWFSTMWLEILLRLWDNISEYVGCNVKNGHVLGMPYI